MSYTRATAVLKTGTIIGDKYRLDEPIGQGGMATVWRAVHTTLDRPVAVKFLEAVGTGAGQLAERFLQEAKLAANLRHRHVVDILDFGVTDGDKPYMVMELLEGQSLADRYTDGPPVTDWEVLEIVAMTLSGLAAVHDAGILHRDVKPENIFLVHDADGIFPKLLDFGISRGFGAQGRVTRTGVVVGTPQYMSPEQARGKKDLDARSDLFSVAVVLYEGFGGEVPFDSENPGDVLIAVATEEPRSLSELRPDLPASVIDLVDKGLAKNPADRFQSAREMRDALMQILAGAEDMTGRPPSTVIRTAYASTPGTGKLRILSVPPGISDGREVEVEIEAPAVAEGAPTLAIEPARLPPPRVAAVPAKGGGWLPALVVTLLLLGGGGYAAWHFQLLPGSSAAANGREGELRPGDSVPLAARAAEQPDLLEPPPEDGASAPRTETVDVPSPPDPPARAPEDSGEAAVIDAGPPDAGVAPAPDPQPQRRRRGRRRPRNR